MGSRILAKKAVLSIRPPNRFLEVSEAPSSFSDGDTFKLASYSRLQNRLHLQNDDLVREWKWKANRVF